MEEIKKDSRGGKREGAGRPAGTFKAGELRKNRTLKATDAEWELIKKYAKNLKLLEKSIDNKSK